MSRHHHLEQPAIDSIILSTRRLQIIMGPQTKSNIHSYICTISDKYRGAMAFILSSMRIHQVTSEYIDPIGRCFFRGIAIEKISPF